MTLRKTNSIHSLVRNKIELWKYIHLYYWIWSCWLSISIKNKIEYREITHACQIIFFISRKEMGISFIWRSFHTILMLHLSTCRKNVFRREQSINRPPGTSRSRFTIENALGFITRPNNMWTAVKLTVFPQRLTLTGSIVHGRLVRPHRKMLYIEYGFSGKS